MTRTGRVGACHRPAFQRHFTYRAIRSLKKGFLFLGFATCGSCGYCITAERHTKKSGRRYYYYRCTHKTKKQHCDDRRFVRDHTFAEEVKRNAGLAVIPEEWKEKFLARIETWEGQRSRAKQPQIDRLKTELAESSLGLSGSITGSPTTRSIFRS